MTGFGAGFGDESPLLFQLFLHVVEPLQLVLQDGHRQTADFEVSYHRVKLRRRNVDEGEENERGEEDERKGE